MDSSWNIGSIGMAGPPLRGPSSPRLLSEPPLSPPVSAGAAPTASAQPLQPSHEPLAPPTTSIPVGPPAAGAAGPEPAQRQTVSLEALLMRFRLITSEQLDEALREKAETGKDVGAVVVERGWVNEDQLARLLTYAPAFPASTDAAAVEPESASAPAAEVAPLEEHPEPVHIDAEAAPVAEPFAEQVAEPIDEPFTPPAPEPGPMWSAPEAPALSELPPALELIEPEPDPAPVAAEPVVVEPEPVVFEPEPIVALEPLTPEADPFKPEPEFFALQPEPVAVEPEPVAVEPAAVEREPVAVEPEPVALEPEPVALELEPVAVAPKAVVVEPEPVAAVIEPVSAPPVVAPVEPEAQPEPQPEPAAVAAEAQVVRFVEPPAIETIARVFVRLSNGERVEAGSFDDMAAAKARAEEVVAQVSTNDNGWPFFAGRYIRPEAVVSVDVDATLVRYA